MTMLENKISLKSSLKTSQLEEIDLLAQTIISAFPEKSGVSAPKPEVSGVKAVIDPAAMFKLSYGLFVLTAEEDGKDNGCIINTVTQITASPARISIAVNKANYTCGMISRTGEFNVSVLTESTPFSIFEQFGFHSGKDTDKFAGAAYTERSANGIRFIPIHTNSVISAKVTEILDYGTHSVFIAEITGAAVLSNEPSATYQYYFDHIKPKPQPTKEKKTEYVCKICGYVYEGDELPEDFVCPLCKHGAEDFEKNAD
jgi:flavin reductase (DIM6/NTAB) family NADH-FMN oxidoreductase RutF